MQNFRVRNSNKTLIKQQLGELRVTTDFSTEEAAEILSINKRQAYKLMSELNSKQKESIVSLTNCPICCGAKHSELSVTVTDDEIKTECAHCSAICQLSGAFWKVSSDGKYTTCSTPVRFARSRKPRDGKRKCLFNDAAFEDKFPCMEAKRVLFEDNDDSIEYKFRCMEDKFRLKRALRKKDKDKESTSHHDTVTSGSEEDCFITPKQKHARFAS